MLMIAATCLCGCANPASGRPGAKLNATEQMMWSTYPVGTRTSMATGFVVARKDALRSDGTMPVVVTSLHVLKGAGRGPLMLAVRVPDAEGEPQVAVIQVQPRRSREPFFVRHPSEDIGAFELKIPSDVAARYPLPSCLEEKALSSGARELRVGEEVTFLGFPDVFPGTPGAFPLLRSGKIASYPTAEMRAGRKFVINADVYPGDSGAPVFARTRGGRAKLVGMIVQRIGLDARAFSHFAIAVDASAIRETLQLLAERKGRRGAEKKAGQ